MRRIVFDRRSLIERTRSAVVWEHHALASMSRSVSAVDGAAAGAPLSAAPTPGVWLPLEAVPSLPLPLDGGAPRPHGSKYGCRNGPSVLEKRTRNNQELEPSLTITATAKTLGCHSKNSHSKNKPREYARTHTRTHLAESPLRSTPRRAALQRASSMQCTRP